MVAVARLAGSAFASISFAAKPPGRIPRRETHERRIAARSPAGRVALIAAIALLSACAATPPATVPMPAPRVESLPELMHRAQAAATSGDKERARELYRAGAKVEPTSPLPWLKLAESYFESSDYGNAVLAAQEVLQRDASDISAANLLTLSGLRVSAMGLVSLRQQNAPSLAIRTDAESLSKSIRDYLNESGATARTAKDSPGGQAARPRPRPPAAAVAAPPARTAPPPRPATAASGANPFDSLK